MPAEQVMPRADFMYKLFVDQAVKTLVEEGTIWEKRLAKVNVGALNVRYYKEQYMDIETPNDSDMSRSIDPYLKSPAFRAPGSAYAHTGFGEPKEYNLGLYQLALEVDVPEEAQKYVEMENMIVRAQRKLGNSFASRVNSILGEAITENWTGSTINIVSLSAGEWSDPTASDCRPIANILAAAESISDVAGYSYTPDALLLPKQSYFDLRLWIAEKNFQYGYRTIDGETKVLDVEGYPVYSTNMIKRDYGVMADFKACGTLYEAEPLRVNQYWSDATHVSHIQADRTFNFALSDPKAVCLLKNLA